MEEKEIFEVEVKDEFEDEGVHVEGESSEPVEDRRSYQSSADDDESDDDDDEERVHANDRRNNEIVLPDDLIAKSIVDRVERAEAKANHAQTVLAEKEKQEVVNRFHYLNGQLAECEQAIADSVSSADGVSAQKAIRMRDDIRVEMARMKQDWDYREEQERQAAQQAEQHAAYMASVQKHAAAWQKEFGYHQYDSESKKLIGRLDDEYAKKCPFPPSDPRYWKGFSVFLNDYDKKAKARQMKAGNQNQTQVNKSNSKTVYISRERKEALIQAGVWDDPVLRTKYVKKYQEWDRENANAQR